MSCLYNETKIGNHYDYRLEDSVCETFPKNKVAILPSLNPNAITETLHQVYVFKESSESEVNTLSQLIRELLILPIYMRQNGSSIFKCGWDLFNGTMWRNY